MAGCYGSCDGYYTNTFAFFVTSANKGSKGVLVSVLTEGQNMTSYFTNL